MSRTIGVNLDETSEVAKNELGSTITSGKTTYIYLKNQSSATPLGKVFAYTPGTFEFEALALNATHTGKVRPFAVFNRDRNANNFIDAVKDTRNIILYSEAIDNAAWDKASGVTITANATTAPDGTTTADSMVSTTAITSSSKGIYPNAAQTIVNGAVYRMSAYLKAGTHTVAQMFYQGSSNIGITIDLTTGVIGFASTGISNYTSQNSGNGWWRVSMEFTATNTTINPTFVYANVGTDSISPSVVHAGTEAYYIWGIQVNLPTDSTTYNVTTSTQYHDVPSAIDIPASHYAWAAIAGELQVTALASCVKYVPLYTSATAGYLDDASGSQTLIQGVALTENNVSSSFTRLIPAYATRPMATNS